MMGRWTASLCLLLPLCVDGGVFIAKEMRPAFVAPSLGSAPSSRPVRSGIRSATCNMHQDDIVTTNAKGALFIPATSRLSWREYRSRLCKAETPYWMRRASMHTMLWAHEITELERGCVLLSKPKRGNADKMGGGPARSGDVVVLLLQHDKQHGSYGLIINKPTPCEMGDFTDKLPGFASSAIHFGGEGHAQGQGHAVNRELHTLHTYPWLSKAEEVVDGIYLGADLREAQALAAAGKVHSGDFKFYYSAQIWGPGELEKEMGHGRWIAAACHRELLVKPAYAWERPLWRTLVDLIGGKVALMGREHSGEL